MVVFFSSSFGAAEVSLLSFAFDFFAEGDREFAREGDRDILFWDGAAESFFLLLLWLPLFFFFDLGLFFLDRVDLSEPADGGRRKTSNYSPSLSVDFLLYGALSDCN